MRISDRVARGGEFGFLLFTQYGHVHFTNSSFWSFWYNTQSGGYHAQSNGAFGHSLWGCSSRKLCALALAKICVQKISLREYCGRRQGVWKYISWVCPPQYNALSESVESVTLLSWQQPWPSPVWTSRDFRQNAIAGSEFGGYLVGLWLTAVINLQFWIWASCLSTECCTSQHNTSYVDVVVFCTPWNLRYCSLDTYLL